MTIRIVGLVPVIVRVTVALALGVPFLLLRVQPMIGMYYVGTCSIEVV